MAGGATSSFWWNMFPFFPFFSVSSITRVQYPHWFIIYSFCFGILCLDFALLYSERWFVLASEFQVLGLLFWFNGPVLTCLIQDWSGLRLMFIALRVSPSQIEKFSLKALSNIPKQLTPRDPRFLRSFDAIQSWSTPTLFQKMTLLYFRKWP